MLSSPWGPVFWVLTFKICAGDLGNSCFCDQDDDASASSVGSSGSGSWNNSSVPVSSDSVSVLKRIQVLTNCLGDTQHFFACSIVVSVLFNDTLCLSLLVSRVLKVGSHLAHMFLPCLWVFCHVFPSFGLGQSIP